MKILVEKRNALLDDIKYFEEELAKAKGKVELLDELIEELPADDDEVTEEAEEEATEEETPQGE